MHIDMLCFGELQQVFDVRIFQVCSYLNCKRNATHYKKKKRPDWWVTGQKDNIPNVNTIVIPLLFPSSITA